MATADRLPEYLVEMGVASTTSAWALGISALGSGTVLRTSAVIGVKLATVTGLISAKITRGRNDELGQMQAGQLDLTMDNSDGRFSPDNTASPYWPNVVPTRQVRISARYGATWLPIFFGFIESLKPIDNGPADSNVTITATDWLARAAIPILTDNRPAETDIARVTALVSSIGSDTLPFAVVGPSSNSDALLAKNYATAQMRGLQALQEITDGTRGTLYQARDGTITYRTRQGRWTSQGAFAASYYFDQTGINTATNVMPYTEPLDYDQTLQFLYNDVQVTPGDGGAAQIAGDTVAQTAYGKRTVQINAPLFTTTQASSLASFLLSGYKAPQARVHSLTVDPDAWVNGAPLWDALFQVELGDTLRVKKQQPGSLAIDRTMFVEGISHDIQAHDHHHITYQLSDQRQAGASPWILSTSALGSNAYLNF